MSEYVVLVTCPPDIASSIASTLVAERLVACVNIIAGVTSIYRWKEKVESDSESLLVMKTTDVQLEALEKKVLEIHPYDTPEFLALSPAKISSGYLSWLRESTCSKDS